MASDSTEKKDPVAQVEQIDHDDHPEVQPINTRNATMLFLVYLVFYAGFMGLASYAPKTMGMKVVGGVNLAICYGVWLIVSAVLLAMVYMWLCDRTMKKFKSAQAVKIGGEA